MGKRLYVGNLNYRTTEDVLTELFEEHGTVIDTTIIEGKGFGFVEMETDEQATAAKDNLNEAVLDGRSIRVDEARPRPERTGGGGGGGGGGWDDRGSRW